MADEVKGKKTERISIIGLGYTGLALAVSLVEHYPTLGFDINPARIEEIKSGIDRNLEVSPDRLRQAALTITNDASKLKGSTIFIVTVPTLLNAQGAPDLSMLEKASELVAQFLQPDSIVVYESTVYPGVTEEFCAPILARVSQMRPGIDFGLAYSPERINPGDKEHNLESVVKVVAAQDQITLNRVKQIYESIVRVGVYCAPSIRVAEAAKLVENVQRDINVAFVNEIAVFLHKEGLSSKAVLDTAATKWNFARFSPGLVGGPCISVVPHYLLARATELGYTPNIVSAARRLNEQMADYAADEFARMLISRQVSSARVAVCGVTFKADVPEVRNSLVAALIKNLLERNYELFVHDPVASPEDVFRLTGLSVTEWSTLANLDGIIVAVGHTQYRRLGLESFAAKLSKQGVLADINSIFDSEAIPNSIRYWSL